MKTEPSKSLLSNSPDNGIFLDIGCGDLKYTNLLKTGSRSIISLDIYKPQNSLNETHHFILSSVEAIPFKTEVFDFVYTLSVIELIKDDKEIINEMYRILKPDGKLYITVPTRFSPFRIIRDLEILFGVYRYPQFNIEHYHYYSKKDIRKLVDGKFSIENFYGYQFNFLPRLFNLLLDLSRLRKPIAKIYNHFTLNNSHNTIPEKSVETIETYTKTTKLNNTKDSQKNFSGLLCEFSYHLIITLRKV